MKSCQSWFTVFMHISLTMVLLTFVDDSKESILPDVSQSFALIKSQLLSGFLDLDIRIVLEVCGYGRPMNITSYI